jgi:undecaprenyl-diphosphatase
MNFLNGWPGRIWFDQLFPPIMPNYYLARFFQILTELGSPLEIIFLTAASVITLLLLARRLQAVFLLVVVLSAWVSNDILKLLLARPRPAGETLTIATGYSFPSGHAMISIAFYGFLAYLFYTQGGIRGKFAAAIMGLLILLIGISRVYLNVHYPSDILGGWILGLVILLMAIYSMKRMSKSYPKPH